MRGYNELHLNTATMIDVVQQWLDVQMPEANLRVTSVKPTTDSRFEIGIVVPDVPAQTDAA